MRPSKIRDLVLIKAPRHPYFDFLRREIKPIRHYANDCVALAIERNRLADNVRIFPEATFPESVAHDDDLILALPVLFGKKRSPVSCSYTQDREKTWGNGQPPQAFRLILPSKRVI